MTMGTIALIGTCDSKLQELLELRKLILDAGARSVLLIDVGRTPSKHAAVSITQQEVLSHAPKEKQGINVAELPRGELIKHMTSCAIPCIRALHDASKISGIIAAGGSGGTSLTAAVMREGLPIGFPKLIVSTVASGDTGPLIGESDITMMYSVVDIAGSNGLLRTIFANAAGAIVGASSSWQKSQSDGKASAISHKKLRVGITMFGVTTPCVDKARTILEEKHDCECYVFHATGHGGVAMERLISQGQLDAVLDITTTEICDHMMGGNMSAGPHRLEAAAKAGIPYVVSLGATDMVNFGPKALVPERYQERLLYEHNPTVTLMRTTPEECQRVGGFIADKLTKHASNRSRVQVVLPLGGVSLIATPGAPFADERADSATFDAIRKGLQDSGIVIVEDKRSINEEGFAIDIAERLVSLF